MFCTKSFGHRIRWIGKLKSRIPFYQEVPRSCASWSPTALSSWQSSCLRETLAWELLKKRPLWSRETAEYGRAPWISASALCLLSEALRGRVSFSTGFHELCSGLAQGQTGGGHSLSSALLLSFVFEISFLWCSVSSWNLGCPRLLSVVYPLSLTGQCFMLQSFHFLCPYKMSYSSVPLRLSFS